MMNSLFFQACIKQGCLCILEDILQKHFHMTSHNGLFQFICDIYLVLQLQIPQMLFLQIFKRHKLYSSQKLHQYQGNFYSNLAVLQFQSSLQYNPWHRLSLLVAQNLKDKSRKDRSYALQVQRQICIKQEPKEVLAQFKILLIVKLVLIQVERKLLRINIKHIYAKLSEKRSLAIKNHFVYKLVKISDIKFRIDANQCSSFLLKQIQKQQESIQFIL